MSFTKRIKSSSLLITLIISILIAILCSTLILLSYNNRILNSNAEIEDKLNRNLESAKNIVLTDTTYSLYDTKEDIDLFDEGSDSVTISKINWGLYRVASIKAFVANKSKKSNFFVGVELPNSMNSCIYLADKQRPLALVGDVKLVGDAFLPIAGLRTAYIDQRGFSYKDMINGSIKKSNNHLPELDSNILLTIKKYINEINNFKSSNFDLSEIEKATRQSFTDSIKHYYSQDEINLSSKMLSGQIVIVSKTSIIIDSTASLSNVILIAPTIKISQGFKGSIQAFATKKIDIEKNCQLLYPSSVVLCNEKETLEQINLKVEKGTTIQGALLGVNFESKMNNNIFFEITNDVKITGVIYVDGFLSLQGIVYGTVLTNFFMYKSPVIIYENYLVDVEINRSKLSPYFLTSPLFNKKGKNDVLEWVE